jgi:hypothetical protein
MLRTPQVPATDGLRFVGPFPTAPGASPIGSTVTLNL